jgi:hypothetical protein
MERYTFFGVIIVTLLALAIALLIPGKPKEQPVDLPWQIDRLANGNTRVFGLELGKSTLSEIQSKLEEEPEVSLFLSVEGRYVVEAFFQRVKLSGLRAKMVVGMDLTEHEIKEMYNRGVRIATLGSGTRKVTLSTDDNVKLMDTPIATITYLPKADLGQELVERRFGKPSQRVREQDSPVEHWLYPEKGLDIALSDEEKDVLQYTVPTRFEALVAPLFEASSAKMH